MAGEDHKPWQYALVQHLMWLIIAEDSVCAERTPPWGCATLEDYADRLAASLDALENHPELHLNFDFSAVELRDLADTYPAILRRMRKLAERGRVSFLNGTYSQPHLQMLSVESTIRQFSEGMRVIEELTGRRVRCYAGQEPGLTPQLPQILASMGFTSAATPDFPFGLRLTGGHVQHWDKRWEWLDGDDLVSWRSPDGSAIPLWLKTSGPPDDAVRADEHQHGLLGHPRLRANMPDMVRVTHEWVSERARWCEFVSLEDALCARSAQHPPRAEAYVDANYAYCEGVDAEELSRRNSEAETALLSLEALRAFIPSGHDTGTQAAWRMLLKAQHHDAYWTGAPELREKAKCWLRDLARSARAETEELLRGLGRSLPSPPGDMSPVIVASPYAAPRWSPVEVAGIAGSDLTDTDGNPVPAQQAGDRAVFVAHSDGLGYGTYLQQPARSSAAVTPEALNDDYRYSNRWYHTIVSPGGLIRCLADGGLPMLLGADGGNAWLYLRDGEDIPPEAVSALVTRGPVFDAVESRSRLGGARLVSSLRFYHDLPWFEVQTTLCFDGPTEIGDYFDDRTKLHFAWHPASPELIRHSVGGCSAEARPGRSFIASHWVDTGGIALCFFGATKCWVDEDGRLRCVAAWGHNGDRFHNRQGPLRDIMGPLNWRKPMDLRLRGAHTIRYAVWPHGGGAEDWQVADWAASLHLPPVALHVEGGSGQLPWSKTFISLQTPGVVPLSVRRDDGTAVVRMMETAGQSHDLRLSHHTGAPPKLRTLDGTPVIKIGPHKIVEAVL